MSTEVAVKQDAPLPSTEVVTLGETTLSSDVLIPRLLLMQGQSRLVQDGKAMPGVMVRSTTAEVLGDEKKDVGFIPLTYRTLWMNEELITMGGQTEKKFRGFEVRDLSNENAEWQFMRDGCPWQRTKVIELFALLPADIEADLKNGSDGVPDLDKVLLPVVIAFRGKSYNAGKELVSVFTKIKQLQQRGGKVMPYNYQMTLGCTKKENAKGKFSIFVVSSKAEKANPEHSKVAARWYATLMSQNISIDNSEVAEDATEPTFDNPSGEGKEF